jgi:hypothetical protein
MGVNACLCLIQRVMKDDMICEQATHDLPLPQQDRAPLLLLKSRPRSKPENHGLWFGSA